MSIEARNISKAFGRFPALSDVSVTFPDGKLVALLGPSGCGKSTLLRIISGLESADAGQVLLRGADAAARGIAERGIGFVFQHYALFRHMTVFENIAFGLRVRPRAARPPRAEIDSRVNELLALMQIEGLGRRYPAQLSGGQRQRVALARALAPRPEVLLLDEPFGALDAKVRQDLRRWLRRLHDEIHLTSVFVTHDQEEALELADSVVVMNKGRIEQVGTPEEVFHRPATPFVAEFLGSVNLFHARVEAGRAIVGGMRFDHPGGNEGGAARVYIRPHEIDLSRDAEGPAAIPVRITRIRSAGPSVKVDAADRDGNTLEVDLSHERHRQLGLLPGEEAFAAPRGEGRARVFGEDYAI